MTHDDELIARVKAAMIMYNPNDDMAQLAIAAVRAFDVERRSSVLDAAAVLHDPDDYRDLPLSMTGPAMFEGGLTTEKRK